LLFSATRVIRASRTLTDAEKLTWLEHYGLDGADGCYCGAGVMAERLGRSREMIEVHRRRFLHLGLLVKAGRGPGLTESWFPTLPPTCVPSSERLSPDQLGLLADRLDLHLVRLKGGRRRHTTVRRSRAQLRTIERHSGAPPSPPNPAELSVNRRTTVTPESLTVGKVGEAGDVGEVGRSQDGIPVERETRRGRDDDVEARYGI